MFLNITQQQFNPDIWNQMLIKAANSRNKEENHKHICRVIYPSNTCTLELKTDQEIKEHFKTHGRLDANCGKIKLREVINITRINSLNNPVNPELKDSIKQSLTLMASRAEKKYSSGFIGILRKIASIFFNFFVTDSVGLFGMPKTNFDLVIVQSSKKHKLPLFIGNDAHFARLVIQGL